MFLTTKPDQELLLELKDIVQRERDLLSRLLHYLREVESRKLHLEKGYASMFSFCTEFLGYSEAEAHIRIQAMRLMRALPVVEEKIQTGELSLTVAAQVQSQFRREEKRRKVENLPSLSLTEKSEVLKEVSGQSVRQSEKKLAEIFPESQRLEEKVKPVTESLTRIEFYADKSLMEKLEKLRNLMAHKNFEGRLDQLFHDLADMALKKLDPELSKVAQKEKLASVRSNQANQANTVNQANSVNPTARALRAQISQKQNPSKQVNLTQSSPANFVKVQESKVRNSTSLGGQMEMAVSSVGLTKSTNAAVLGALKASQLDRKPRSRFIAKSVRQKIWVKAKGQCEYQDPETYHRCSCRHGLQVDHIFEFARGGLHSEINLRLLCGAHNRWRSEC